MFARPEFAMALVFMMMATFYVSSLSTNSLRALLVAVPVSIAAAVGVNWQVTMADRWLGRWLVDSGDARRQTLVRFTRNVYRVVGDRWNLPDAFLLVGAAGFLGLLLRFTLQNHRSADRPTSRVLKQAAWILFSLAIGATLLTALDLLSYIPRR